ncbi:MAG: hypothetical protein IIA83_04240 [Thaumarchaeota archaeon]|nr:hypothetical protein [Nitrososphaerota archaeon]
MQRSLLLFENSLKTEATREKYLYYLGRFKDFYKLKDYDSMLTIPIKQLQIMLEDYVMMLKKKVMNGNDLMLEHQMADTKANIYF